MSHQALLFCTDEKTTRVVTQVLTELDFVVEPCCEPFVAVKKLMATQFDAIVVDCDNEQNATLLFKSARNSGSNQGSLAVAVVEGQAGVAKAFRIGANLVLTKPINVEQSKGTLRVARGLLKKAEAGKAVAPTSTSSAEQTSRLGAGTLDQTRSTGAPPATSQKSVAAAPFAALRTPTNFPVPASTAVSSSFEVAHDATPKPEPAEAAFLESIPDPLSNKTIAHVPEILGTSQKTKSPWQPLPGSIGETKETSPGSNPELGSVSTGRRPFSSGGLSTGAGTAAAPAKIKEAPLRVTKAAKPSASDVSTLHNVHEVAAEKSLPQGEATGDAPHFAESAHETKSSKMPLIAAIVVIAMAAAGYFGWSKMHIGRGSSVAQGQPNAATVGSSAAASPVTESGQADEVLVLRSQSGAAQPQSGTMQSQSQPAASQSQPATRLNQQTTQSATPVSGKPAPGKAVAVTTIADSGDEAISVPEKKAPEGLTVKGNAVVVEEKPVPVDQTIAPPPLQGASAASDKTIAGLMGNTPLPMPKRAEILKVSQGITEGMLLTRVKPVYPPQAVQMHKQGTVLLSANINKNGSISDTKLIKGDPILAQAALAAVKQWKYKPYTLNGQPVDVQTQIAVNFKLP
jgi:periplasmic protein TonB